VLRKPASAAWRSISDLIMGRNMDHRAFEGKVIDAHSHLGVDLKMYCRREYPYAQTVEGLYYRQLSAGVDVNVVFPFSGDLYFEPAGLLDGCRTPAENPLSKVPYASENLLLMQEVYEYRGDLSGRFIPFVCIDPGRRVAEQIGEIRTLASKYAIYGMKVNPVGCASSVQTLRDGGKAFLDLAAEMNWPMLFHAVPAGMDDYSSAEVVLDLARRHQHIRFCLAHCLQFRKDMLACADAMPNVWVDTAALFIQVKLVRQLMAEGGISPDAVMDCLPQGHCQVMRELCRLHPRTIIWGSDSPAYSYICVRKDSARADRIFRLSGAYEDEIAALKCLPDNARIRACSLNTLVFLFGQKGKHE
jgi:predicted TIM-barrel fold metal-dependent hydrolase